MSFGYNLYLGLSQMKFGTILFFKSRTGYVEVYFVLYVRMACSFDTVFNALCIWLRSFLSKIDLHLVVFCYPLLLIILLRSHKLMLGNFRTKLV